MIYLLNPYISKQLLTKHHLSLDGSKLKYTGFTLNNPQIHIDGLRQVSDICAAGDVSNTPLNPYISKQLLTKHHLSLDGSKLKNTGFTLNNPQIHIDGLHQVRDITT